MAGMLDQTNVPLRKVLRRIECVTHGKEFVLVPPDDEDRDVDPSQYVRSDHFPLSACSGEQVQGPRHRPGRAGAIRGAEIVDERGPLDRGNPCGIRYEQVFEHRRAAPPAAPRKQRRQDAKCRDPNLPGQLAPEADAVDHHELRRQRRRAFREAECDQTPERRSHHRAGREMQVAHQRTRPVRRGDSERKGGRYPIRKAESRQIRSDYTVVP